MNKTITSLIVCLCLLSLQFLGYVQTGALPGNPSAAYAQAQSSSGVPLQPGKVTYINTWNISLSEACNITQVVEQPLQTVQSNWTIAIAIPSLLFMGRPLGQSITQTYVVYANGAFRASDDQGNSFGWAGLAGLPKGTTTTSLLANSTYAVLNYQISSGGKVLANVTLSYRVRYQYCQPAGLKISIQGNVNWGAAGKGAVVLGFSKSPLQSSGYTAWFGNNSGALLGFDWSDSAALGPSYSASTNSLSWNVGSVFTIDPKTIGTTNQAIFGRWDHLIQYAQGRWWFFYNYNGGGTYGQDIYYITSTNGTSWSAPTLAAPGHSNPAHFDIAVVGSTVMYVNNNFPGQKQFVWNVGTLSSSGSITWSYTSEQTYSSLGGYDSSIPPSLTVDSSGNIWAAFSVESTSTACPCYAQVLKYSSGTWSSSVITMGASSVQIPQVLPLTAGKMELVTCWGCAGASTSPLILLSTFSGSSWSNLITAVSASNLGFFAGVSVGDTAYVAYEDYSSGALGVKSFNYTYGAASASAIRTIYSLSSADSLNTALTTDSYGNLYVTIGEVTQNWVAIYKSSDGGNGWSRFATIVTSESNQQPNSVAALYTTSSLTGIGWLQGASSPYNIRFASLPLVIPDAATSSQPWSKPGLSPYEDFFAHETEYVSPGNGLLGIRQTDYSLPGRGLDLQVMRVFSTPYAFSASSPYGYDNYTLSNLGLGWQLNFPWLGQNYLHLWDGQVYAYSWAGNVFENHRGENFKLVNNGGSSYDLYTASGVDYHFDSSKRLVSVTDQTGNNTIQFSYNANNEMSTITDAVGRGVTFSYNANGQLTTMSTGEGNWVYSYSGNNLASVWDPLGRTTSYQYNTGINTWLMSAVLYPTGAMTNYTYGSAPVGTEVTTYYATSQNIYVSSNSLTRSENYSYHVINGVVQSCNMTVSDGYGIKAHVNYNYTGSTKSVKTEENENAAIILSYENDFDSLGRTNETKILSPTNVLLAYSISKYDNWGNQIYGRDLVGHETWYSYSNTNTSNTFSTSGFSNSFYSNTAISANIHDALLGQAQYQNGAGTAKLEAYFQYNSAGDVLQTKQLHNGGWIYTSYTYDSYGNRLTATDALGRTAYFQYSSGYNHAYLTQQSILVSNQNVSATYSYNFTNGVTLSQTDPNGFTTNYAYDDIGRLTTTAYPLVNGVAAVRTYSYNDAGNYITITDENGNVVKEYFDGLERLIKVISYNGTSIYSTESYTYGWLSQPSIKTTPIGSQYKYYYDSLGRVYQTVNPDGTSQTISYDDVNNVRTVTDENGHPTKYGYDWAGNLIWVKQYYNSSNYYTTNYTYDLSGNLLSVSDAKAQVTTYQYDDLNRPTVTKYPDGTNATLTYDSLGNILSKTDPMRNTVNYAYDALNRLVNVTYPNHTSVTYSYDKDGNRVSMSDQSGSTLYKYDARDRLTNQTDVIGGASYPVLYSYDKASNIISMVYPDGYNLTYKYDPLERVSRVGGSANFTYTVDNKINTISYANGVKTTYTYDSRDRPTRILAKSGTGTTLLDLNYTYDGTGNVLTIDNEKYSYDWLNRISSGNGSWGTINYSYDAVGNILKMVKSGVTTTYSYGSYNRLSSAGSVTFSYNANGDQITKVNGSNTYTYTYDYENRLTSVVLNGVTKGNLTYNGDGQRVKMFTPSYTLVYVCQSNNLLYQKNVTSGLITKRFYANGMPVAEMIGSSTTQYYHLDALGSVRLTTGSSGTSIFSSNYQPFGLNSGASGAEYLQYTGKPFDAILGLYYFGARYYDDSTGRFITEDSRAGSKSDPLSLNRYMYARDNPEKYVDPNGHMFTWIVDTDYVINPFTASSSPSVTTTGGGTTSGCGYFGCGSNAGVGGGPTTISSINGCGYFGCGSNADIAGGPTTSPVTSTSTSTVTSSSTSSVSTITNTYTITVTPNSGDNGGTTTSSTGGATTVTETYTTSTSEPTCTPSSENDECGYGSFNWGAFDAGLTTGALIGLSAVGYGLAVVFLPIGPAAIPLGEGVLEGDKASLEYLSDSGENANSWDAAGAWLAGFSGGFLMGLWP